MTIGHHLESLSFSKVCQMSSPSPLAMPCPLSRPSLLLGVTQSALGSFLSTVSTSTLEKKAVEAGRLPSPSLALTSLLTRRLARWRAKEALYRSSETTRYLISSWMEITNLPLTPISRNSHSTETSRRWRKSTAELCTTQLILFKM